MKILLNFTFALAVTFAIAQDNRPQGLPLMESSFILTI